MKVTLFDILAGISPENVRGYKVYVLGKSDYFRFNTREMIDQKDRVVELISLDVLRKTMLIKL